MNIKKINIFLLIFFFLANSCVDPEYDLDRISDEMEINPAFALPLMNCTMTVEDILKQMKSEEYSGSFPADNLAYVTFMDSILTYPASNILDIPDQNFLQLYLSSDILANPLWVSSSPGDTIMFRKDLRSKFTADHNEKIDSLKVKSTSLRLVISSTFRHRGIIHIHSANIKRNGQPFSLIIPISSSDGTFNMNTAIPYDNLMFTMDNSDPANTILPVSFELYLIKSGNPVVAGQQVNINMTYQNIQFSSAFGYLGNYDMPLQTGDFDLDLYEKLLGGSLTFEDPRLSVFMSNSYGVPVQVTLSNVSTYSEINNTTTPITFAAGSNPFSIGIPDHVGETEYDTLVFNKDNCNLATAMSRSPSTFNYTVSARTNPAGISGPYNFLTDSSNLDMIVEFLLPLNLKASNVTLKDTMEFDVEKDMGDILDVMKYLRFTIQGTNGLPLEGKLQLTFTDSLYNVTDSLFRTTPCIFTAAQVNTNGKATGASDFSKTSELNESRLEALRDVKYIITKAIFNTTSQSTGANVKFYSYDKLDFKISLKSQLKINNRELK